MALRLPLPRFNSRTSNDSEIYFAKIKHLRCLPIDQLVYALYELWHQEIYDRSVLGRRMDVTKVLVPKKYDEFHRIVQKARDYEAAFLADGKARVSSTQNPLARSHLVDLNSAHLCSCRGFNKNGLPCRHAVAVCTSPRNPNPVDPISLCARFTHIDSYINSYSVPMEYVPKPVAATSIEVHPPSVSKAIGRPKNKRGRGRAELQEAQNLRSKCSRCKQIGHNSRTCREAVN